MLGTSKSVSGVQNIMRKHHLQRGGGKRPISQEMAKINVRLRVLPIAIGSAARHKLWHRSWTPPTLALLAATAARSQWKTARIRPENPDLYLYEG